MARCLSIPVAVSRGGDGPLMHSHVSKGPVNGNLPEPSRREWLFTRSAGLPALPGMPGNQVFPDIRQKIS
ncbi:hypothetical protein CGMCC3_g8011 [Colletotrichum fructicola]|nr:uncharacterized protein CGMCC3_g8011 [Colletotrichum fructicola]KAE9575810.1 hypothetical protein CGMCC3_g8011 [Colletotrichum fructicola]